MQNLDYRSEYWLYDQHINKKLTYREIGKKCGVDRQTIWKWMKKFGIKGIGTGFQASNIVNKGRKLTPEHKEKIGIAGRDEKNPRWKGGQKAYHNRKARKIWEEYWQEKVPNGHVVHHVDKDVTNNNICNLALLTFKYHMQIHRGSNANWL